MKGLPGTTAGHDQGEGQWLGAMNDNVTMGCLRDSPLIPGTWHRPWSHTRSLLSHRLSSHLPYTLLLHTLPLTSHSTFPTALPPYRRDSFSGMLHLRQRRRHHHYSHHSRVTRPTTTGPQLDTIGQSGRGGRGPHPRGTPSGACPVEPCLQPALACTDGVVVLMVALVIHEGGGRGGGWGRRWRKRRRGGGGGCGQVHPGLSRGRGLAQLDLTL
ncbi:hypothetical protein E2C01_056756 [Portunus trituberculatus]|uniref:Uncharacterized protein n=1 Tax=Portunus trituberculatus TaxID=210409 RepID=A0A5B7H009_PORTR|nr:hypothetical protein [Portunus trituberculatus]